MLWPISVVCRGDAQGCSGNLTDDGEAVDHNSADLCDIDLRADLARTKLVQRTKSRHGLWAIQ